MKLRKYWWLYFQLVANNVLGFILLLYCKYMPGSGVKNHILNILQKCVIFNMTFLYLFGMFCHFWLNFETFCIICHQFLTQPTERFSTSPNTFACYAWQHSLILDEKSNWNEQVESIQMSRRPMGLFLFSTAWTIQFLVELVHMCRVSTNFNTIRTSSEQIHIVFHGHTSVIEGRTVPNALMKINYTFVGQIESVNIYLNAENLSSVFT